MTVGQTSKALGVSRQRIHQLINDKQLNGVVWMLERWAIPEAEVRRIKLLRKQAAKSTNGNGHRK